MKTLKSALWQGDLTTLCGSMFNLFESVVLPDRPVARQIKETLLASGAITAMMSGSGPSVFGLFADRAAAEKLCGELRSEGVKAFVTRPRRNDAES